MQHQKSKINKNQNKTEDVVFDNYYGEHSYHRLMWSGHSFCHICECVCLSVCIALTSEILDLESSFLVCSVCGHTFRKSGSLSCIKVIGSMSRSQEEKGVFVCVVRGFSCLPLRGSFVLIAGSSTFDHIRADLCVFLL